MKYYELTYLVSSETNEEDLKKLTEEIDSFIQKEEGVIAKSGNPFPETLAYPIKKQKTIFWISLEFCLSPEKIEGIKKKIKKEKRILRFVLISKKGPKKQDVKTETNTDEIKINEVETVTDQIAPSKKEKSEKKVELKEIEEKLDEILNE